MTTSRPFRPCRQLDQLRHPRPSRSRAALTLSVLMPVAACAPLIDQMVPPRYGAMSERQSPVRIDWPALDDQPQRFVVQSYGIYDRAIADYGDLYGAVPRGQLRVQRLSPESRHALTDAPDDQPAGDDTEEDAEERPVADARATPAAPSQPAGNDDGRPALAPVRAADPRLAGLDLSAPADTTAPVTRDGEGRPIGIAGGAGGNAGDTDPQGEAVFAAVSGFLGNTRSEQARRALTDADTAAAGGADPATRDDAVPRDPVSALEASLPLYFQRYAYTIGERGQLTVTLGDARAPLDWVRADTANARCVLFSTALADQPAAAEVEAAPVAEPEAVAEPDAVAEPEAKAEEDAVPDEADDSPGGLFESIGRWFADDGDAGAEDAGRPADATPDPAPAPEPDPVAEAEPAAAAETAPDPVADFFARLFGGDTTETQPEEPVTQTAEAPDPAPRPLPEPRPEPKPEPEPEPQAPPLPATLSTTLMDGHLCVPQNETLDRARIAELLGFIRLR
ncbi:hypothetical protein WG926_05170 [Tistrella sp. BH-R2-4]|uniref:Uncharacterized protein n=1 Tax=Tistrella arctica TaxID=3133430 RepID=A0ABU9YFX8_9PROT